MEVIADLRGSILPKVQYVLRAISLVIVVVLVHGSIAAQDQPQFPPQTVAKMLHKAQEKDKAVKVILTKKIDKQRKFSGKVSDISVRQCAKLLIHRKRSSALLLCGNHMVSTGSVRRLRT